MADPVVNIDVSKLEDIMWDSAELSKLLRAKAEEINTEAAAIFESEKVKTEKARRRHDSRVSSLRGLTRYAASFKTKRVRTDVSRKSYAWLALNDDREAFWVEVGAHAGGKTQVLKYRCFGRALDIVKARAGGG
jgi:hypothetical protein